MAIEIRPATAAEMPQLGLLTAYVYAGAFGDGADNVTTRANRPEWTLCAFDGTKLVASYATIPFTMRANGRAMPLGGVSVVGTLPDYRRRGLLRAITERAFAGMRDAGQPIAALWASQAAIYQRYGYSLGSAQTSYAIDSVDVRLLEPPDSGLTVTRASPAEAFDTIKAVYRDFVADRTLYLHRSRPLWQANALAEDATSGPAQIALCADGTDTLGYVVYTLRHARVAHATRPQELVIRDFVWRNVGACRALWQFLAAHDLVGRIAWPSAPRDDPTPELIAEPRLLHAKVQDGVWFRVVDVARALAARGYDADGELVIGVAADREAPWNEGSWRLAVSGGGATVERTRAQPELRVSIKALSSLFTGFRRVRELVNAGLLEGDAGVLARADALLATRYAPHCPDRF